MKMIEDLDIKLKYDKDEKQWVASALGKTGRKSKDPDDAVNYLIWEFEELIGVIISCEKCGKDFPEDSKNSYWSCVQHNSCPAWKFQDVDKCDFCKTWNLCEDCVTELKEVITKYIKLPPKGKPQNQDEAFEDTVETHKDLLQKLADD